MNVMDAARIEWERKRTAELEGREAPNADNTSWVVASKATGKAVFETYSAEVVGAVNREKYEVYTIYDWLVKVNAVAAGESEGGGDENR